MTEHEKARAFREARHLTRSDLAALTGYTENAVYLFERGSNSEGKPHDPRAWQRYKMACLAVRLLDEYKRTIADWEWE
jgi:transcriptional regulator with XRE-family HTH domain